MGVGGGLPTPPPPPLPPPPEVNTISFFLVSATVFYDVLDYDTTMDYLLEGRKAFHLNGKTTETLENLKEVKSNILKYVFNDFLDLHEGYFPTIDVQHLQNFYIEFTFNGRPFIEKDFSSRVFDFDEFGYIKRVKP